MEGAYISAPRDCIVLNHSFDASTDHSLFTSSYFYNVKIPARRRFSKKRRIRAKTIFASWNDEWLLPTPKGLTTDFLKMLFLLPLLSASGITGLHPDLYVKKKKDWIFTFYHPIDKVIDSCCCHSMSMKNTKYLHWVLYSRKHKA